MGFVVIGRVRDSFSADAGRLNDPQQLVRRTLEHYGEQAKAANAAPTREEWVRFLRAPPSARSSAWSEHSLWERGVEGSNPSRQTIRTKAWKIVTRFGSGRAQVQFLPS